MYILKEAKGFKIVYETCEKKKKNIIHSVKSHAIEQMEKLRLIQMFNK